jgi:hypothetical protein
VQAEFREAERADGARRPFAYPRPHAPGARIADLGCELAPGASRRMPQLPISRPSPLRVMAGWNLWRGSDW